MGNALALENAFYRLSIHPESAVWSLEGCAAGSPALLGASVQPGFRQERRRWGALECWGAPLISEAEVSDSPHGPLRQVILAFGPDEAGLRLQLVFALPERHPLLFWKLAVDHRGSRPVEVETLDLLRVGMEHNLDTGGDAPAGSALRLGASGSRTGLAFFSNGWQSWSYTGVYSAGEPFQHTRLGPLRTPTDVNAGTSLPNRPGRYPSEMFGVIGDRAGRAAVLAGFLSQRQHFGTLDAWIGPSPALRLRAHGDAARLDPGARFETDWACLHFLDVDNPDPLGPYLDAVAREHGLIGPTGLLKTRPVAGWCSWYQYCSEQFTGTVTARDVAANLAALEGIGPRLPLDVFQIDDGFESQVGDWFSFSAGFPGGVDPLAGHIRRSGRTPGLWLAPFIVHPRSRLAAEHPGWLLRGRLNLPANAGYLWGGFARALDLTHPDALAYAAHSVRTAVQEWGFHYLKLDFLYAAALPGRRRDATRTRAQVLRSGLEALRHAAGEQAFLLGCGCPLGPAIGLVDAMRIGPDTARRWRPAFYGIELLFKSETNLPAARNAVHNTLTRAALHRRWWINDPDCLLLRPDTELTLAEVHTLATAIALSGGSLLLSDNLATMPPERLRIAEVLLPLIGRSPWVLDWFESATPRRLRLDLAGPTGRWHLLALFNWEDSPQDLSLIPAEYHLDPQAKYLAREFWRSEIFHLAGAGLVFQGVPAHGTVLLALRPLQSGLPQYLGSDLHISQGLEVCAWDPQPQALTLCLERPGLACGHVDLRLPQPPRQVSFNGQPLEASSLPGEVYRFPLCFDRQGVLRLAFDTPC